uniref:DUF11 domain-containing protein n=1 Tax=Solibacter usitatus (strain Ellin6076) TaxID=234267 RepID=Q02BC3_SOLUE
MRVCLRYLRAAIVLALAVTGPVSAPLHAQESNKIKPLFFTKPYGGAEPLPQILTVTGGSALAEFRTSTRTSSGGDWLSVSPTQSAESISVQVNSSLEPGDYSGEVVLDGSEGPRTVEVHLVVTPAGTQTFDKMPSQISFSMEPRGVASPQVMQVGGVGAEALSWRLIASTFNDANFLSVSATSGTGPTRITVGVIPEKLPGEGAIPGVYTGRILLVSDRSSVTIPVRVSVGGNEPRAGRPLPMSKAEVSHSAVSQPASGPTNLFPASTVNCYCGGFNSYFSNFGGLTVAPDGTASAQLIGEANPESGAQPHAQLIYTDMGAGQHTISFHFKADSAPDPDQWVYITSQVDGSVTPQRVWFNLSNGTVGSALPTGWTAQITAVPGATGWYRASVTFTATSSAVYNGFGLAQGDNQWSFTGTYGNGVYEWGQQFENGPLSAYQAKVSPCLSFSKTANAASVTAGSAIGYTIGIFNHGSLITPLNMSDPLPAGTGINWSISSNTGPGLCNVTGAVGSQILNCDFSALTSGVGQTIDVISSSTTSSCGAYSSTATLSSSAYSYSTTASASTSVLCAGVTADSVTPNSGSGSSQTFALQYSETLGASSLSTVWVWFSATFGSAANSCMVYYDRSTNNLNLINDAGTQWQPGTPGIAATLQNSQCSINLAGTSVALGGNTLTLNLALTFKPAYAGAKNIYMYGADASTNSGWQTRGTWTATAGSAAVTADSVAPSSGSGSTQTFALQYSDTAGASSLSTAWVWFSATFGSAANSCMVYYDRAATTLYLINDAGAQWLPGTPGAAATLQNSQCSINLAGTNVALAGNTLTLNLALTFKPAYAGAKNVYMYDAAGATNSGWQTRGTWTATAGAAVVTADSVTPGSGSGSSQTFALQYSDSLGASSLSTAWVWFSATFGSAANSCMIYYDRAATTLYLINDAGTQWLPGTPGAAATLQNSQCSINLAGTSVALAGNTLTLNLALTFKPAYAGAKNVYMYGAAGATNSAWQTRGTWTATAGAAVVTADSVTPGSGSGSSQTFALQYSDTAGASSFSTAWAWFSATFGSAANSCMIYYDRAATTLYLINDAGTQWLPGTPGAAATLQNSQCSINLTGTSVALASNTLTLNLALTFKPAYAGAKNIYMYGADASTNSGWQTRGTWTAQ